MIKKTNFKLGKMNLYITNFFNNIYKNYKKKFNLMQL